MAFVYQMVVMAGLSVAFIAMFITTCALHAAHGRATSFRIAGALTLALTLILPLVAVVLLLPPDFKHPHGWLWIFLSRPGPGWVNIGLVVLQLLLAWHLLSEAASRPDPLDEALAELEPSSQTNGDPIDEH